MKGVPYAKYLTMGIIKTISYFPLGSLILFSILVFNQFSSPQTTTSILVSLLFHAALTHAHFLRFSLYGLQNEV